MSWPCAVPNLVSKSTLMMGARRDGGGAGINQTPPSQHLEPSLALLQSLTAYSQQPRQLRHVHCDAPSLIERQHLGDVSFSLRLASVDVDEGLARCVQHLEAARYLLDRPRWWETAW